MRKSLLVLIKLIFFFDRKKGQVAPKWGSASNNIVKNIKRFSYEGREYKIIPYNIGKIIGNLTKSKSNFWLIITVIFNFSFQ